MNNSLLIGKYIKKFIMEDEDITSMIGSQVYPLYTNQATKYPYVVYARTGIQVAYTKDGNTEDTIQETIVCCSNDYEQSLLLVNAVRHCFENGCYKDNDINIVDIKITSCSESSSDDCYIQTIVFDFKIQ